MGHASTTQWKCTVCGYVHTGDQPPGSCPVCNAPSSAFEKIASASDESGDDDEAPEQTWHRVAGSDELPEGRVRTITVGHRSFALTRHQGKHAVLQGACPHQGGPIGEGSIEQGVLRCPWHGWDYDPLTGKAPGFDDGLQSFPTEEREDGVYVGLQPEPPRARTVSDVMVETMAAWGVRHVFGMVGHSNLGLADAVRRQAEQGRMTYFGVRHEGAAAFACSGYAKLTGRPAACLAIAGPGATNLLTGLWDARMDRMPVLALTGQVKTQVLGRHEFQEVDLAAAFQSVAAFSQTVHDGSDHAELVNQALKHALLQRDVAHLIFPDQVQTLPVADDAPASGPEGRMPALEVAPPEASLAQAVTALAAAKRPTIIVGHGARFAMEPIVALAERLGCPVATTFKGKGLIADDHPLGCGVLGRSGTPVSSYFMNASDLLLVFGASFSAHTGITAKKKLIQVDFDPMSLGKRHAIDVPVLGEVGVTARQLLAALPADAAGTDRREAIAARWAIWRAEKQSRAADDRGQGLGSAALFAALSRQLPADAVIAVDVGNNTYSFGRYFECQRQSVLMSGYLGSIGFGFPAAMGAWAAATERPIVAVCGDGGFGQYMGELTTAVKYGMNITCVLLNNGELGKITKEQRAARLDVWQTDLHNPDFSRYAENCGALGLRVRTADQLGEALPAALAHQGPALVEVLTDASLI